MIDRRTFFSGSCVERRTEIRSDPAALAEALAHPETRFLPVWRERCLVEGDRPSVFKRDQVLAPDAGPEGAIFLGQLDDRFLFAVSIDAVEPPEIAGDGEFLGLRELSATLSEADAALIAYAKAMVSWQQRHLYCGVCGVRNRALDGGFLMACPDPDCAHKSFPRLDPAVIVLVHRDEYCLLGRQVQWSEDRFSTIAGFVEPGESLEDAIRREVHEETNINVGRCDYIASQPWPFPSALMIGYHVDALTQDIQLNDGELAEARWLTRDEIAAGAVILPPRFSIAYRLIETWFDLADRPHLATLDLPNPPFRSVKRDN